MITKSWDELVEKNIMIWGMSGQLFKGKLVETIVSQDCDILSILLELKDGYICIPNRQIVAVAWKKDLAEIAANAPELADYPELPGGWPQNYSKKPKSSERPKPEPDERFFAETKKDIIYIPVDVSAVPDIPTLVSQIRNEILAGVY